MVETRRGLAGVCGRQHVSETKETISRQQSWSVVAIFLVLRGSLPERSPVNE